MSIQLSITKKSLGILPISQTLGSIPFVDGNGDLIEDNPNLFWDDANNRLGIGTSSPTAKLEINGQIKITGGTPENGRFLRSDAEGLAVWGDVGWTDLGTDVVLQNSGNNVGIGTATPNAKLDVTGTPGTVVGGFASGQLHVTGTSTDVNGNAVITGHNLFGGNKQLWYLGSTASANDDIGFINRQNANLVFLTNNVERVRIKSSGFIQFNAYGAGTLTTDALGNITATSDERLKDIQGDFTVGLKEIVQLSPINYKWNEKSGYDTETIYSGFSAQDVQRVIPSAVNTGREGYLSLSDRPIIAALVNAVKELTAKVETLEARAN